MWTSARFRCLAALTALTCLVGASASRADLVGYWPLDTVVGGETPDVAGGGHDGSLLGTPPTLATGQIGNALEFSGAWSGQDQRVQLGTPASDPELFITGDFTVTAWVKATLPPATTGGEGRTAVASYDWDADATLTRGFLLGREWQGSNNFDFKLHGPNGEYTGASVSNFFTTPTENPGQGHLGEWVHVAGVYEAGESMKLYVDGVLVATDTSSVPDSVAFKAGTPLNIGRRGDGASEWGGLIDDVALYSHALNGEQIAHLANQTGDPISLPEPATLTLLALGGLGMAIRRRRTH